MGEAATGERRGAGRIGGFAWSWSFAWGGPEPEEPAEPDWPGVVDDLIDDHDKLDGRLLALRQDVDEMRRSRDAIEARLRRMDADIERALAGVDRLEGTRSTGSGRPDAPRR